MNTLAGFLEVKGRILEKVVLFADYGRRLIEFPNNLSVDMFIMSDLSDIPVIDLIGCVDSLFQCLLLYLPVTGRDILLKNLDPYRLFIKLLKSLL